MALVDEMHVFRPVSSNSHRFLLYNNRRFLQLLWFDQASFYLFKNEGLQLGLSHLISVGHQLLHRLCVANFVFKSLSALFKNQSMHGLGEGYLLFGMDVELRLGLSAGGNFHRLQFLGHRFLFHFCLPFFDTLF